MRSRTTPAVMMGSMLAIVGGSGATPARASAMACPPDADYGFTAIAHNYVDMVTSSEGSPGTGLSITLNAGKATTYTAGATLSTSEDFFIGSAQQQVNASIAKTVTNTTTHGFAWTVPSNYGANGYLHVGGDREASHWTYGQYNPSCQWVVTNSGATAQLPYHAPVSWHNKQATGGENV